MAKPKRVKRYRWLRCPPVLITFALACILLPLAFFVSSSAADTGNSIVFYACDSLYEKTAADAAEGNIGEAGLPGAMVYLVLDGTTQYLTKISDGEYVVSETADNAVTEAEVDENGRIIITGLDTARTDYRLWVTADNAPYGFFEPTFERYITFQEVNDGGKTTLYGVHNYVAREIILRAQLADSTGLNGAKLTLFYAGYPWDVAEFVYISDGIYRHAREGEIGTKTLVTGTVNGEDGVVLIRRVGIERPFQASAVEEKTDGFYVGTDYAASWKQHTSYYPIAEESIRLDCGTAIYYPDDYNGTAIPLPTVLRGYGDWEIIPEMSDEFDGQTLDLTKWKTVLYYETPENSRLSGDGYYYALNTYDSVNDEIDKGGIASRKTDALYGYFECRFKAAYMPSMNNFWLLSQGEYTHAGEIDVCESIAASKFAPSGGEDRLINMNAHYPYILNALDKRHCPRSSVGRTALIPGDEGVSDRFFTYSVLWEPGKVTYYLDGVEMYVNENDYASPMGVIMDCPGYFDPSDYTAEEYNDTYAGFPINAMAVDYVRSWTRTDITYTPVPAEQVSQDGVVTTAKTPHSPIGSAWALQTALSDEFDNSNIEEAMWGKYYNGEVEAYETLRLPRYVFDDYNGIYPVGSTGLPAADDYLSRYYRNRWVSNSSLATSTELGAPYGYGYYEFRARAAENSCYSTMELEAYDDENNVTGRIRMRLIGDPLINTQHAGSAMIYVYNSGSNEEYYYNHKVPGGTISDYHIYGVLREEDAVTFYVDGVQVYKSSFSPVGDVKVKLYVDDDAYSFGNDDYDRLMDGRDNNFYVDYARYYIKSEEPGNPIDPTLPGKPDDNEGGGKDQPATYRPLYSFVIKNHRSGSTVAADISADFMINLSLKNSFDNKNEMLYPTFELAEGAILFAKDTGGKIIRFDESTYLEFSGSTVYINGVELSSIYVKGPTGGEVEYTFNISYEDAQTDAILQWLQADGYTGKIYGTDIVITKPLGMHTNLLKSFLLEFESSPMAKVTISDTGEELISGESWVDIRATRPLNITVTSENGKTVTYYRLYLRYYVNFSDVRQSCDITRVCQLKKQK